MKGFTYVLEYNKEQDAYHIQTLEKRSACDNNNEWEVVVKGSLEHVSSALSGYTKGERVR